MGAFDRASVLASCGGIMPAIVVGIGLVEIKKANDNNKGIKQTLVTKLVGSLKTRAGLKQSHRKKGRKRHGIHIIGQLILA